MAFKRKKIVPEPEPIPKHESAGDTLARIEAVTDRLEWLAEQIEKQLKDRETKNGTS